MVSMCNGKRDTCIPLCTLLLPLYLLLPLPLPIPYYYPYSSPYLPPWVPPAFLEGWGQDRVRGHHLTAKYYYGSVVCFRPIQRGGGGRGGMPPPPPGGAHDLLPTPTPPFTYYMYYLYPPYYSPGAWSEVTSMVTCVMMRRNSLIHYYQSMKHIYMDTVHKLS